MNSNEIRSKFLKYFKDRQHAIVPSSSVAPHDDPTLLFTNAGMNQFKDIFLGQSKRDYNRAVSSQKCIRVGGKHNDLENVGHTRRHLTFFEMLGNFSFGDYFKEEAIQFAWEVSTEVFGFDPKHLWASVFEEDDEAFELWTKYIPIERVVRLGASENFWSMGDTGPCGPCSELYYDRGPSYGEMNTPLDDPDGDRFLEYWNLVFMQFNQVSSGERELLPKPSVDTGAGLERIMSVLDDVDSVFETDILRSIIAQVENVSGKEYDPSDHHTASAFRVIADHLRCLAFAIADGVQPSNVDRGYVLRKVLRRAVRYGRQLGLKDPFLAKVLPTLVDEMSDHFSELRQSQNRITEILTIEEESFIRTLNRGGNLLNQIIESAQEHGNHISGDDAFKMKDTYGFPIEEILLLAKDSGLDVDLKRYEVLEEEARERSRAVHKTTEQLAEQSLFENHPQTTFIGYEGTTGEGKVTGLVKEGQFVDSLQEGEEGCVILDQTPFYAEMGGQVGDTGNLTGESTLFEVKDTQSPFKGISTHIGQMLRGELKVGDSVQTCVNAERRQAIENNHTATHLLHWALHEVLGEHVRQAGSVVDANRTRFDFSHHKALTQDEIRAIEDLVNEKVRENVEVGSYEIPYEKAQQKSEIKQFFGDKYDSVVRVIDVAPSKELCGGTHTSRSGNIGLFKIISEKSIAAGIRRIEAVSGKRAEDFVRGTENMIDDVANLVKTTPQKLMTRLEKLLEENQETNLKLKKIQQQSRQSMIDSLVQKKETVKDIPLIVEELSVDAKELRTFADETLNKMGSGVLVLGCRSGDKGNLIVRISDDCVKKGMDAKAIIQEIAPIIGGSGGGKPSGAQAGGTAPEKLGEALSKVRDLLS
ncbi:MAG: Alanine--tRNA ligase [Chlamydiae bacterium]|nr:Alanine--tRNA ligase [Chlamydiota bacterium]